MRKVSTLHTAARMDRSPGSPVATPAGLPAYALYGEADRRPPPEQLHSESIASRSSLHDWEIRPHRHEALYQVLVVASGACEATLDGVRHPLQGPAAVTVPALSAHGFRFAPNVRGWVFTLNERHLKGLLASQPGLLAALQRLRGWAIGAERIAGSRNEADGETTEDANAAPRGPRSRARSGRDIASASSSAARMLHTEVHGHDPWRSAAIDAALLRLLVAVARSAPKDDAPAARSPARALAHVQRLRDLVEQRFRTQPDLASVAAEIGITPTQLNRVCHQVLGHSALGVLHARTLLEAQRLLGYGNSSIKQISLDLGFSDAGYFTRFFHRLTQTTPSAWRAEAVAQRDGGDLDATTR